MQYHEVELSVGDVVLLGEQVVMVVDIDGDDVTFRVDDLESFDDDPMNGQLDFLAGPLPR